MSYGNANTVVDLNTPGPTLVIGEDLDNTAAGEGGNGVGKTTLMNALVYCLYDKPISDIKVDDLINNINKKNLEVQVEFERNGNTYLVTRYRKAGKGFRDNGVRLEVNGKDETRDSTNNTTKAIEQILGMSYDMFVRIVVVSATHQPFLDLPVRGVNAYQPNQSDFIERLFDLTILSEKALVLKEMMKSVEESIKVQKGQIQQLEQEHMRHYQAVEDAKKRVVDWESNNKKTIKQLRLKLDAVAEVDFEKEKQLQAKLTELNKQVDLHSQLKRRIEDQVKKLEKNKRDLEHEISHLQNQKCPYCLQDFAGAEKKIEVKQKELAEVSTSLETILTDRTLTQAALKEFLEQAKKLTEEITVQDLEELLSVKAQSESTQQKIIELEKTPNPLLGMLEDLEKQQIPPVKYDSINEHTKTLNHQEFLLKLLTKKDSFVRKALLNKNIPFLNARLAHYLTQLGLPHKVEFTHEMTAEISQFARPMGFGNLSNGQRARVNLALSFAFRDVLQRLHTPVNICMLDEVLDVGLDDIGVSAAARMLKRKARDEQLCMFIISHRNELDNAFDRTLIIQMYKGFSHLKQVTNG